MKTYNKPLFDLIEISTEEVLQVSGLEMNNTNAGFNNPDEIL